MSKQELLYILKSMGISYLPVMLVSFGVNYMFNMLGWSKPTELAEHLSFPIIIIFIVSIINLWNVDKRRPALLKRDEYPVLPAQATLNTVVLIFILFLLLSALQFIGVAISGKGVYEINKADKIWFNLLFVGVFSIVTLIKKLKSIRNQV